MKLYISNYDNENITVIEVADTFEVLRTEAWDEDVEGSDYEIAAAKLRKMTYRIVNNPCEIYDNEASAKMGFDPLLCF